MVIFAPLNISNKGYIPTGITKFGAPEVKFRSKQFGLLYDQNRNQNLACAHGPNLSEFLSHLEQEFDNFYFYMDGSP